MASNILNSSQHFNVGVEGKKKEYKYSIELIPGELHGNELKNYYCFNQTTTPKHCYIAIGGNIIIPTTTSRTYCPFFLFTDQPYNPGMGVLEDMKRVTGKIIVALFPNFTLNTEYDFCVIGSAEAGNLGIPSSVSCEVEFNRDDVFEKYDEETPPEVEYNRMTLKVLQEVELNPTTLLEPVNKFLFKY